MVVMIINECAGLSLKLNNVFNMVRLVTASHKLSVILFKTYNDQPITNSNFYPIYGFTIANTKFYKKSLLSEFKRLLPKDVNMEVSDLSITFYQIDPVTREAK